MSNLVPEHELGRAVGIARRMGGQADPVWIVQLSAILIFILAASNGRPFWTSSGLWVIAIAPFIILGRGIRSVLTGALTGRARLVTYSLIIFVMANFLSASITSSLPDFNLDSIFRSSIYLAFVRGFLPLLTYLALVGLPLRPADTRLLMYALAAGCFVMLARVTVAYLQSVGIPDLHAILWARYDAALMAPYADAGLGNVGNFSSYLVLIFPPFLLTLSNRRRGRALRITASIVAALIIVNLVLSGSRTAIALGVLTLIISTASLGVRTGAIVFLGVMALLFASTEFVQNILPHNEFMQRFLPGSSGISRDRSAVGRYQSIVEGWRTFSEHPFLGVGPGNSRFFSSFVVPHQSMIYQLSELGIVGGVAFGAFNFAVWSSAFEAFRATTRDPFSAYRWLWISGPAIWLLFGFLAGINFTNSLALAWMGVGCAMLGLSEAKLLPSKRRGQENPFRFDTPNRGKRAATARRAGMR